MHKSAERENDRMKALLERFELPLLQYATRIIGDRDRARDVVQETFVRLQRDGADLHPPSHSSGVAGDNAPVKWLFTVCRNRALNVCRKERRMIYLDEEILEAQPGHESLPSEKMEQSEARGFLMQIVASLPPRQQEVLQLKFQNDLSYQQIAEITKTSANSVGVLIHTALKTLRQRYGAASRDFIPFTPRTTS
jgi:RNA polymerase sigma factor (sigma-70 family)